LAIGKTQGVLQFQENQLDFESEFPSNKAMIRQPSAKEHLGHRLAWLLLVISFLSGFEVLADETPAVLTNAADILALSRDQAGKGIPVVVRGVVTGAEPTWRGQFFIEDGTSGIFVVNHSDLHPEPGDLVEVKGFSQSGAFAPTISRPTCTKLGTAPLPKPKRVPRDIPLEQLMSGLEDSQRVEIEGIVRAVVPNKFNMDVELADEGYRIHAFPRRIPDIDPQSLVGARVRVRGTAAASWTDKTRHRRDMVIFVPVTNDFVVVQMETTDPFDKPIIPLTGTVEYRRDILPGQRVHVKGVVTLQRPGQDLFLHDDWSSNSAPGDWATARGLHVQTRQTNLLSPGDVVEVVGFPDVENYLPVLGNAIFRKTSEKRPLPEPDKISFSDTNTFSNLTNDLYHADMITLDAKLLEGTIRPSQTVHGAMTVSLLLQTQGLDKPFIAHGDFTNDIAKLTSIPVGSTIEISGICFTESGEDRNFKSLQLLLSDFNNIRILREPSPFTPQRLLIGVGILFAVLVVAVSWSVMVSKKNSVLSLLIREREAAQLELQHAHDQLEERVKERTAQLKFQISARKESEVQFKATLKERTRLAQELHDTLEQSLTGIALQLDTTSKLFEARPEGASHHLELARGLVTQSQVDVRRSVWDLRSRALEQFDLPGALSTSGKQLVDGTNIQLGVAARGRVRPLPDTVEENLLRIAQEALTNVIKHSEATKVSIELDYGPQNVALEVKDNGRGFEQDKSAGPGEGHFGLLGISERVKRLGGELVVNSANGHGTVIRVQIPLEPNSPNPDFTLETLS
jgi:signal transduction histidine kinase